MRLATLIILLLGCLGAYGAAPSVRTVTIKSSGGNYTSLSAAEDGEDNTGDLVSRNEVMQFECYAIQDTAEVAVSGWTTDSTHYVRIYAAATARHSGVWDDNKYRLSATGGHTLAIDEGCVRVEGLQLLLTRVGGSGGRYCLVVNAPNETQAIQINGCIIRGSISGTPGDYTMGIMTEGVSGASGKVSIWNTLIYGFKTTSLDCGMFFRSGQDKDAFNISIVDCYIALYRYDGSELVRAKNVLISGCTTATLYLSEANCGYNATDLSSLGYTSQTGDRTSQTFTFVGAPNYHLASTDAGARDHGTSDPGSGLYSDDIDGETRTGTWDIGADEYVAAAGAAPARRPYLIRPGRP